MDLFKFFKSNKEKDKGKEKYGYAQRMSGRIPSYLEFGSDIMNDETVYSITKRIIDEYSKLNPKHIRKIDDKLTKVSDNRINTLLAFPNNKETISDFLAKACFMRESFDNVFIYPMYDLYVNNATNEKKKIYKELRILQPRSVDFYEDDSGTIFIEFTFANNQKSGKIAYDDIIHWRKDYGINEFMGGDELGMPNNTALLRHLRINDKLIQSTIKTIDSSLTINGILKLGGLLDESKREEARLKFEKQLQNSESGIMTVDSGADYTQISYNGQLINKDTLDFMDAKILKHYGVSEAILKGDYNAEQKEAFYESVLEAGINSLGQAFTRVMLTPFERANGNEIVFYTHRIQMMSHDKKIALANLLMPVGGVSPNTVLSWFGEPPYEGGDRRYRFLNWIPDDLADQYQLDLYNGDLLKENNTGNNTTGDSEEENAEKGSDENGES